MRLIQRLTATFKANVEHLVDQIENQDAVISAAIDERRTLTAKAKARLARLRRDHEAIQAKLDELDRAERQWEARAIACAPTDEGAALDCLERRNRCRAQRKELQTALSRLTDTLRHLEQEVHRAEEKIEAMGRQQRLMRGRQAAAEAITSTQEWSDPRAFDVEGLFERWEERVLEVEMACNTPEIDPLERRFERAERDQALRTELKTLMGKKESRHE